MLARFSLPQPGSGRSLDRGAGGGGSVKTRQGTWPRHWADGLLGIAGASCQKQLEGGGGGVFFPHLVRLLSFQC